ncbi:hypothetical protein Tco_1036394 [Tanacetum coccineum]
MAEDNVPAPAATRSDEYILPFNAWLPIGKGNLLLDLQKSQKNPIFRISGAKTGVYSFQLDEHWFTLNADLLHEALEITPVDSTHPFESPSAGEQPAPTKQSALAKQTKPVKEKLSKPTPSKKFRKGKVMKVRKEKRSDHLIDEEDEEP